MTNSEDEVVVEVAAEGAGFALYRRVTPDGGEQFFTLLNQVALYDMCEADDPLPGEPISRSPPCSTFEEGLTLLDESPFWVRLHVLEVAPAFASRVLAAVEERLPGLEHDPVRYQRILGRWRSYCERAAGA